MLLFQCPQDASTHVLSTQCGSNQGVCVVYAWQIMQCIMSFSLVFFFFFTFSRRTCRSVICVQSSSKHIPVYKLAGIHRGANISLQTGKNMYQHREICMCSLLLLHVHKQYFSSVWYEDVCSPLSPPLMRLQQQRGLEGRRQLAGPVQHPPAWIKHDLFQTLELRQYWIVTG